MHDVLGISVRFQCCNGQVLAVIAQITMVSNREQKRPVVLLRIGIDSHIVSPEFGSTVSLRGRTR